VVGWALVAVGALTLTFALITLAVAVVEVTR
jgi:hypothetical protein